jgi:predicted dehydrogenase
VPLNIGVIGCGYWGPNLVRTFLELPDASVSAVADRDQGRLDHIGTRYPQVKHLFSDHRQLFDAGLDAVVVSTPPETHFDMVTSCLEQGLDVLVEKPLATNVADAVRLAELAQETGRILMVGHIGAYNPAVNMLKQMIESGELGDIRYVDAVRVGLGLFHSRLNVIWDLAPHDISIFLHLLGEQPTGVSTQGLACVQESIEDVAYMTLTFPSGVLAHTRMSWLDPCKTRRITVVGTRQMVVYDDLESHEKLKMYDKNVNPIRPTDTFGDFQFAYHYGSVISPYIHFEEPLRLECQHFIDCVSERKQPVTDGRNGVSVVRVIEAAQRSLREGGTLIPIADDADAPIPHELPESWKSVDPRRQSTIRRSAVGVNGRATQVIADSVRNGSSSNGNGHPADPDQEHNETIVLDPTRDAAGEDSVQTVGA